MSTREGLKNTFKKFNSRYFSLQNPRNQIPCNKTLKSNQIDPSKMEKRLRSSLETSAEEFLSTATKLGFKSSKPSLKTLIWRITPTSELSSSLPLALNQSITRSVETFKNSNCKNVGGGGSTSTSPPTKRVRRSARHQKNVQESSKEEESGSGKKALILENLQIYTHVAFLCVSHPKEPFSPADLLPSVEALHESLILFGSDSNLMSEIANVCEQWWKLQLPWRETLISQSLPYLVSRSLTLKKKVDVHRVYALREAFAEFDFDDESSEDLKLLLLRCVISPLYLKTEEGRRFVASLFGLNMQLLKEALGLIRSQIPFGRKSMLEAYADILFRAWKVAEGSFKDQIENRFLQDLIDGAIHAGSSSLAASIRRVLGGFISQRTTSGVEKLLFRLTEPIIFRSLQVANSNVRQNALHLLLDVFPLEDPASTKEDKDILLEKQFFLLEKLFQDECPDIRVTAVEGSCRILNLFWEIIPTLTITKTIKKIFDYTSYDASSEVRVSTLNGIIYLLGNPQSHEVLKVLLPRLRHLFRDSVISVRAAAVNLLLAVRDIRGFEFHKVVGLEAVLSSLANDQPLIAKKITSLVIPSFFPSKVDSKEACKRCITLIKTSPMAGARFCEFASAEGSSPKSLMELVRAVLDCLAMSNDLNSDQIEGFLVASLNLCSSLVSEACYQTEIAKLFSCERMKQLFTAARTEGAQTAVFNIASIVSPDNVTDLVKECMDLINDCGGLSDNEKKQARVRSAHRLMISIGRFDEMFGAITDLLQVTATGCHVKFVEQLSKQSIQTAKQEKAKLSTRFSAKSKKEKKSNSYGNTDNFRQNYIAATGAAWQIKDLLTSTNSRDNILKSSKLERVFSALKAVSEVSIKHCMCYEYLDTLPVLAYTSLALHMTLQHVDLIGMNNLNNNSDGLDSTGTSLDGNVLDGSLNHLFGCSMKLFSLINSERFSKLSSRSKQDMGKMGQDSKQSQAQSDVCCPDDDGSTFPDGRRIFSMVKVVTAVLKLLVDATIVSSNAHTRLKCLRFASAYVRVIILTLKGHSKDLLQLKEGDLKEMLIFFKSSFTYATKLLNVVLKNTDDSSPALPEAYDLSNNLLNLVMSIESYLGSKNASTLVPAVKPWLSDLVLALGYWHILIKGPNETSHQTASSRCKPCLLPWLRVLGKMELCEISEANDDEESENITESNRFPVFKKFMEKLVQSLRKNLKVLNSVGVIFFTHLVYLLEREEYGVVLGVVHFVCGKLVQQEHGEWRELPDMLASLQELYPCLEKGIENSSINDDGRQMLESAKNLLEPIWMNYISEDGGGSMREEE